ncbi:MAG: CoA-binding protein [Clostridiales bacterium]|nr:CoA-binding protein [Clostridiales bacterium]
MKKLTKDFFGKEVVICGCTKADNMYYKRLYKHFTANHVKVYALPTTPESKLDFQTYPNLAALPHVPKCAYILSDKKDVPAIVEELKKYKVRRILFYSKAYVDEDVLKDCKEHRIEVRCGCPLMLYASGPCMLHAAIGGVMQERKK